MEDVRFLPGARYPGDQARYRPALPPTLQLVEAPAASTLPPGEAIILVRFDADPGHFGGSGADELGDVRRVSNRPKNPSSAAIPPRKSRWRLCSSLGQPATFTGTLTRK
jgi:hypothetical protein